MHLTLANAEDQSKITKVIRISADFRIELLLLARPVQKQYSGSHYGE